MYLVCIVCEAMQPVHHHQYAFGLIILVIKNEALFYTILYYYYAFQGPLTLHYSLLCPIQEKMWAMSYENEPTYFPAEYIKAQNVPSSYSVFQENPDSHRTIRVRIFLEHTVEKRKLCHKNVQTDRQTFRAFI